VFYDIDEVYKKLEKYYTKGDIFVSYIEQTSIFPLQINFKKPKQKDIQNSYSTIIKQIQNLNKTDFDIVFDEFNFKSIGVQRLPVSVKIDTLEQFLLLIKKENKYNIFIFWYDRIVAKYQNLKALFYKKPFLVLHYQEHWERFFLIIDFLLNNKNPNIYIREIVLDNIDTKYIEQHKKILDILISAITLEEPLNTIGEYAFEKRYNLKYPLPQVRFRILDEKLFISGLSDITLCIDEFEKLQIVCKRVFIVENQITTLSFPKIKDAIVIFGSGYKAGVLKNVKWLEEKQIFYWGDIDIDGFAILSQIRSYFKNTNSLNMDYDTIQKYKYLATFYKNIKQIPTLNNLTKDEQEAYLFLKENKDFRIEQEKLPCELPNR